jgi:hypothetical protein
MGKMMSLGSWNTSKTSFFIGLEDSLMFKLHYVGGKEP